MQEVNNCIQFNLFQEIPERAFLSGKMYVHIYTCKKSQILASPTIQQVSITMNIDESLPFAVHTRKITSNQSHKCHAVHMISDWLWTFYSMIDPPFPFCRLQKRYRKIEWQESCQAPIISSTWFLLKKFPNLIAKSFIPSHQFLHVIRLTRKCPYQRRNKSNSSICLTYLDRNHKNKFRVIKTNFNSKYSEKWEQRNQYTWRREISSIFSPREGRTGSPGISSRPYL